MCEEVALPIAFLASVARNETGQLADVGSKGLDVFTSDLLPSPLCVLATIFSAEASAQGLGQLLPVSLLCPVVWAGCHTRPGP